MQRELIREGLLFTLAASYEEDPHEFVTLSRQTVDSSLAREVVAELRNEGYVEEQVRGVIRLTLRGSSRYATSTTHFPNCSRTLRVVKCAATIRGRGGRSWLGAYWLPFSSRSCCRGQSRAFEG